MPSTYLAFDYGSQRTGLAVGNDLLRTAQALTAMATSSLHNTEGEILTKAISGLVSEWRVSHLVFGLPLDANGDETKLSRKIRQLGEQMSQAFNLPVSYADERYSSGTADRLLREHHPTGKRFGRKIAARDSVAAQLILETYFSRLPAA